MIGVLYVLYYAVILGELLHLCMSILMTFEEIIWQVLTGWELFVSRVLNYDSC